MEILLIGPPNVGKSVLFNRLTGLDVCMANYPGTTVDYKKGEACVRFKRFTLIDVPGTYDLTASNESERVAVRMLESSPAGVVFVLDAKNLEGSMHLLLQVLSRGIPTIAVVNRSDLVKGEVDTSFISSQLGIPVLKTVAIEGKGLEELKDLIEKMLRGELKPSMSPPSGWKEAERIAAASRAPPHEAGRRERWGELMVRPFPGIPLAIIILGMTFGLVVGLGLGLRVLILIPFFEGMVYPVIISAVESVTEEGTLRNILIGDFGFLIKALDWPLALVLPYVISFYLALSILEDSGYLPRLAVLIDGVFKRIGLSGSHIIPFLLGYGCAVPAILSTRNVNDRRRRIMISAMICMSIPCVAQSGVFISLLAERSVLLVLALFLFSFFIAMVFGMVASRVLKIQRDIGVIEVPDLLLPDLRMLGKKLLIRIRHYVRDAAVPMAVIIGAAAVLYETGSMVQISRLMEPLVVGWLGLPPEASIPLMLGVFRRELAVLPLLEMGLTTLQLMTASVVALLYIPCIAVLGVLAKEFGIRTALTILAITLVVSFTIGGIFFQLGSLVF